MEPVICSFQMDMDTGSHSSLELSEGLCKYLSSVVAALRDSGCLLIGHIKMMFTYEEGAYLMANITSFDETPTVKGQLEGSAGRGRLTVHAVVYGVESSILERILKHFTLHLFSVPS